ncbi:hypothetical protein TBLA_0B02070 [Henningerozyma blattae CBS 6284]|uniref:Glucose-signaling factor 2 n=1 Tax=Henningerozyma blattae (strain ATCC 34711 / CBS 6284 / DSM 70876 / NBRC 10599 / NRRL Y-10934 / UCD 77-7) TaxID=1071380 RepID=I2GY47_HENB6|nr:hypothetical protein TBLA_0B02070 [Tetrapisispora blattae CBS 6284]CCH59049.1 hypothetical protein TBLA_0B02070 [Tetrapisispora blattae CBS 6284]
MEVYLRVNDDIERDTAIVIEKDDTINNKIKTIFEMESGLAKYINLKPTIFNTEKPVAYYKSIHPGYMTDHGALLFDYHADEEPYIEKLDYDKPLFEQLWPGQLIVPKWVRSRKNTIIYWIVILFWLYTDLPDHISPTPGICLTNQISRVVIMASEFLEIPDITNKLRAEIQPGFTSVPVQYALFCLHLLKIAILTFFLETGFVNPYSINPIKNWMVLNSAATSPQLKEVAKKLGWIGTRRSTKAGYESGLYNFILAKHGGQVGAFRAGVLTSAINPGFVLERGEGFQTPLKDRSKNSTFETMKEKRKFILGDDYYQALEDNLKHNLAVARKENNSGKYSEEIRRFRKYGLFEVDDRLTEMVALRKEVHPKYAKKDEDEEKKKK